MVFYSFLLHLLVFFFFNDTATTEIYTLSLHELFRSRSKGSGSASRGGRSTRTRSKGRAREEDRSEEHTSELQSRQYLVCRLLLEKKKKKQKSPAVHTQKKAKSIGQDIMSQWCG